MSTMSRNSNLRNPSPDCDEDASAAPATVFSHAFVLRTLLELLEESEVSDERAQHNPSDIGGETVELDEQLEQKLCSVWDMSTDSDIAQLLIDNNFIDLFKNRIQYSTKPRLWEILIGIVGNVLCSPLGPSIVDGDLWEWLISVCSCRDSQTLVQLMRCLKLCCEMPDLLSGDSFQVYIDHYELWENMAFIVKFSNNPHLLLSVVDFLDTLIHSNYARISQTLITNGKNLLVNLSQFECGCNIFNDEDLDVWTFKYHSLDIFQYLSTVEDSCNIFGEIEAHLYRSIMECVLKPLLKMLHDRKLGEAPQNHDFWCLTVSLSLLLWLKKNGLKTASEEQMQVLREIKINAERFEIDHEEVKQIISLNLCELMK